MATFTEVKSRRLSDKSVKLERKLVQDILEFGFDFD